MDGDIDEIWELKMARTSVEIAVMPSISVEQSQNLCTPNFSCKRS